MPSSKLAAVATVVGTALLALFSQSADASCGSGNTPTLSYISSSNRIYVDGGCATMADLMDFRLDEDGIQQGPVWHFSQKKSWYNKYHTGTYYLESDIYIRNGATLSIDGTGSLIHECKTLLLASNSSTFVNIRAYGGNLDIKYTEIFSWDLLAKDYDTNVDDGRSYLSAITEKITGRTKDTCPDDPKNGDKNYNNGQAKADMGNANMDIFYSEIGYLGYDEAESYGVAYKARGLCEDLSNLDIFDDDNGLDYGVTGDIYKSEIHHNWFGHYSFAHDGGEWKYNVVHDNYGYGFDPHDDSDNLKIVGNEVYNNGWHGIIASKRCTDITIEKNVVYSNGKHGIMLHRSCDRATVKDNHSFDNGQSGLALFESCDCDIYRNTLEDNLHGMRWSNGASKNSVWDNTIVSGGGSSSGKRYAFLMYKGSDDQEAEDNVDGHNKYNNVYKNDIYSDTDEAWRMKEADSNVFTRNTFHSGKYASVENSVDNDVHNNEFPDDWYFEAGEETCFRSGTTPEC